MSLLTRCNKRGFDSSSQIIKTPPRETLADLQEFLKHAVTAESRRLHDHVVPWPSISQLQKAENADRTLAAAVQSDSQHAQLEFFLSYDAQRGVLQVHLLTISGVASPKCRVKVILGDKMRTSKFATQGCENTLVFDEVLEFSQIYLLEVARFILYLQIYTYNTLSVPSFIGSVMLPLEGVDIYGSFFARTIEKDCKQIVEISCPMCILY